LRHAARFQGICLTVGSEPSTIWARGGIFASCAFLDGRDERFGFEVVVAAPVRAASGRDVDRALRVVAAEHPKPDVAALLRFAQQRAGADAGFSGVLEVDAD
jgi:hypothetical protein